MGILEIISAVLLILSCVFIVVIVLMQDSSRGMSQTITGGSSDNHINKTSSRSKEARLRRGTTMAATIFFVVTILVNLATVYLNQDEPLPPIVNPTDTSTVQDESGTDTNADTSDDAGADTSDDAGADTSDDENGDSGADTNAGTGE